jgi:hypothetical protein
MPRRISLQALANIGEAFVEAAWLAPAGRRALGHTLVYFRAK